MLIPPRLSLSLRFLMAAGVLLALAVPPVLHADETSPVSVPVLAAPLTSVPPLVPVPDAPAAQPPAPLSLQGGEPVRQLPAAKPDAVFHGETLTEDTVWQGEILVDGGVSVASQATLTILPGTVVRFSGGDSGSSGGVLLVTGRLVAQGTTEKPILFSSPFADARAGDWQGILLLGSEKKNVLDHCRIEGAGTGIHALYSGFSARNVTISDAGTGIHAVESVISVAGGAVRTSRTALLLEESEADVRNVGVTENESGIVATGSSLHLQGASLEKNRGTALTIDKGRLKLTGNLVSGNGGSGLRLAASEGSVTGNTLSRNALHGLHLSRSRVRITGNVIDGNGVNGLHVDDGGVVAWGNSFGGNGGYDCFNGGTEDLQVPGNWWGSADTAAVSRRVYDRAAEKSRGAVLYQPFLRVKPQRLP